MPAVPAQRSDVRPLLDQLQARLRFAEDRAAGLERAVTSNRRIGMAVGILMCQHQLTEEQAIAMLKTRSQHRNIKVRELAETVIYTGRL
ncbi:ANTAR domain-containing protein [Geodermatophilus sp. SYSU D00691]